MYKTQLRTSQLGATGMEITRVGFGAWAIGGGGWEFGWGPQADGESIAAIHQALELGINWIDTAAAYGFGRSERVVGQALAGLSERPHVFTKCSLLDDGTGRVRHSLGIGVIAYSPMGSGLLTGAMTRERIARLPADDWRARDPRFTEPQLSRHLALAARLQAVAERHGVTPGAVAVAWVLRNPAVDGAITGFRRPEQVAPIVAAAGLDLTGEDLRQIEASG
jgi:aryl-alcohol dehydrogenase-like predicted oxidoreductase